MFINFFIFPSVFYFNMNGLDYLLKCWNAMYIFFPSVTSLSICFPELFPILQFLQILTKILKEKIVNLIIKSVGERWEMLSKFNCCCLWSFVFSVCYISMSKRMSRMDFSNLITNICLFVFFANVPKNENERF